MTADFARFIADWEKYEGTELSGAAPFLMGLCALLGVPPLEGGGDESHAFERPVQVRDEQRKIHTKRIDYYKEGHFIVEAKKGSNVGAKNVGAARRETDAWHIAMNKAYGQALGYAGSVGKPVPILVVCDINYCFDVYESFDGSGRYKPFPTAQTKRLFFRDLEKHADTLRRIFTDPLSLDPSRHAAAVTRTVAEFLANLARTLEEKGHAQETVARFLMRCLFTMFAEDIGLLPDHIFTRLLEEQWTKHPSSFRAGVEMLWNTMNTGGASFMGDIRHFNGGLFADTNALPLDEHALRQLLAAAKRDWTDVEPAIFGTLIERALSSKERHRLGAHYTPRAYVERLVRPTIEDPLRSEWDSVRIAVETIRVEAEKAEKAKRPVVAKRKRAEAINAVRGFHKKLCELRVLDPACGSGNFLYVALHLFQQIESEIFEMLVSFGETQDVLRLQDLRVTPAQFLGIEIKPWAKEITDLVLWIGYLQWHFRMLGKKPPMFEPVLHDYQNIENRDAILAYDAEELLLDERGKPVTRWDGETTKTHPVTKKEVPDETSTAPVYRYINPRKAEWPKADFIIGNPPFVGTRRMRLTLGDGYVDALAKAIPEVPENADYVMFWWNKAADLTHGEGHRRFGLITTNSISQTFNRVVLKRHLAASDRLSITFAIPDHPWLDSESGAAVRVAMTAVTSGTVEGNVLRVVEEEWTEDEEVRVSFAAPERGMISEDLRAGASPAAAVVLRANSKIGYWGVKFYGDGFIVSAVDAVKFGYREENRPLARPFVSGRDLTSVPRGLFAIDCNGLDEEALRKMYPFAYQHLLDRVKPVRDHNPRAFKRERWWIFGENQPGMRAATRELSHYIVTTETAKHRVFQVIDATDLAEGTVTVIALEDLFFMGVLSSRPHVVWALAAGGRLGVGNDPRYNKTRCFDPFPFPEPPVARRKRIADLGETLDAHRKARRADHPDLTITGMYNVLEKLKASEPLNDKEAAIHKNGLVSILKKIHEDLDLAVLEAYGWPKDLTDEQILEKLVALNAERAEEEKRGIIRWLRPDFQNPTGKQAATQTAFAPAEDEDELAAPATVAAKVWPKKLAEQITAVREVVSGSAALWATERVAACLTGAKAQDVAPILESLAALGHLLEFEGDNGPRWKAVTSGSA